MGANVSNQLVDSTSKITQNIMNSVITNTANEAIANAYVSQHAEIDAAGANLYKCPTEIKQDAKVTALAFGDLSNTLSNELDNKLQAKLKEEIKNVLEQVNKGVNLGQTNIADVTTRTQTYVEQNLKNLIQQSIKNTVQSTGAGDQYAKINLRGVKCVNSPAGITQGMIMNLMAKNISRNLVDNIIKNSAVAEIDKKVEQSVKQKNEGLDLGIGLVIVGIIIVVVLGFTVFKTFLQSPAGKLLMFVIVLGLLGLLGYFIYKKTRPDKEKAGIK